MIIFNCSNLGIMRKFLILSACFALMLMFNACSATKSASKSKDTTGNVTQPEEKKIAATAADSFIGGWSTSVSGTPAGDVNFDLFFEQIDGKYKGYIMGEGQRTDLSDIKVEGNKVNVSFYSSQFGVDVYFSATLNEAGDAISGYVMDSYKLTGKRK